jgi:hypothetical protein
MDLPVQHDIQFGALVKLGVKTGQSFDWTRVLFE